MKKERKISECLSSSFPNSCHVFSFQISEEGKTRLTKTHRPARLFILFCGSFSASFLSLFFPYPPPRSPLSTSVLLHFWAGRKERKKSFSFSNSCFSFSPQFFPSFFTFVSSSSSSSFSSSSSVPSSPSFRFS